MTSTDGAMIDNEAVNALARDHETALEDGGIKLEGRFSVAAYIGLFDALRQPIAYDHVPPAAVELIEAIEATAGPEMVEIYHRLVLLNLIQTFETRAADVQLPPDIHEHAVDFLLRLIQRLQKPKRGQYRLDKDYFLKDLSVARLKLWPCGAELVDIASGIPRRMLLEAGKGRFLKALGQIKFQCGGFKPFFETHFDARMSAGFSAEGYRSLYLTIAQMLENDAKIKGMYSCSWWHDPALARISPNLGFLNAIAVEGGAKLYPMGTNDQIIAQATRLSKERTQQVRAGTYRPTRYLMVWARRDLLRWKDVQTGSQIKAVTA